MPASPFDIMKNILKKQPLMSDEDIKGCQWMLNKCFSCDPLYAYIADNLNVEGMTDRMVYECYYYGIPKTPSKYITYLAKKPAEEKENKYFMEYFGCSQETAKQYMKMISKDEKTYIIKFFEQRGLRK
jgi:hypothetical protein